MATITIGKEEMTEAIERFYRLEHQVLEALRALDTTPQKYNANSEAILAVLRQLAVRASDTHQVSLNMLDELRKLNQQTITALKETNSGNNTYVSVNEFRYVYLRTKLTDFIDRNTDIATSVIRDRVAAWVDHQSSAPQSHLDFMHMLYDAIVSWEEDD